jgi:hypothetical protein
MVAAMGAWPKSELQTLQDTGGAVEDMPLTWFQKPDIYPNDTERRVESFCAKHPKDVNVRILGVLFAGATSQSQGQGLRELTQEFPQSPVAYAALLRATVQANATLKYRYEEDILQENPAHHTPIYLDSMRQTLRPFDEVEAEIEDSVFRAEGFVHDAERGEKLDPNNAYFPWMKSIGLFALNRDDEAIVALHQAAQCSTFDDYTNQETLARFYLYQAVEEYPKATAVLSHILAMNYPHHASLRAHARLVTAIAIEREREGDKSGGMALRRDLARVSQTLQLSFPQSNGYFTGTACEHTAYQYPGAMNLPKHPAENYYGMGMGAPSMGSGTDDTGNTEEKLVLRKEKAWHDYAKAQGEETLANRLHDINVARQAASTRRETALGVLSCSLQEIGQYDLLAASTLIVAVALLLLGGIFGVLARYTRIREGKPAHRAVSWGIAMNIAQPLIALAVWLLDRPWMSGITYGAGVMGGILLGIGASRLHGAEGSWPRRIVLFISTLLAPAGILAMLAWVFTPSIALPLSFLTMARGINPDSCGCYRGMQDALGTKIFLFFAIMSIPVVLLLMLAITSRIRRVSVTVGMTRGFIRWALPLASILVLLYALTTPYRARLHDRALFHVKQIAQNGSMTPLYSGETSENSSEGAAADAMAK